MDNLSLKSWHILNNRLICRPLLLHLCFTPALLAHLCPLAAVQVWKCLPVRCNQQFLPILLNYNSARDRQGQRISKWLHNTILNLQEILSRQREKKHKTVHICIANDLECFSGVCWSQFADVLCCNKSPHLPYNSQKYLWIALVKKHSQIVAILDHCNV